MSDNLTTEADVRRLLTAKENAALDAALESEKQSGAELTTWPTAGGPSEWIKSAIYWHGSPQGHDYWQSIHDRLSAAESSPNNTPAFAREILEEIAYGATTRRETLDEWADRVTVERQDQQAERANPTKQQQDGAPAFPQDRIAYFQTKDGPNGMQAGEPIYEQVGGMSLRDYFAAKAMQGMIRQIYGSGVPLNMPGVGAMAYAMADAMLAARAKP